eukprot:2251344-Prymnesium_polylepis.1
MWRPSCGPSRLDPRARRAPGRRAPDRQRDQSSSASLRFPSSFSPCCPREPAPWLFAGRPRP